MVNRGLNEGRFSPRESMVCLRAAVPPGPVLRPLPPGRSDPRWPRTQEHPAHPSPLLTATFLLPLSTEGAQQEVHTPRRGKAQAGMSQPSAKGQPSATGNALDLGSRPDVSFANYVGLRE